MSPQWHEAPSRPVVALAAWHGLLWLAVANAIGVMLAILLLVPQAHGLLLEWTYGRWIMVHMNLMLFGWTSLPLIGFLFHAYGVEQRAAAWARPVLWGWSATLVAGSLSWLSGYSSGKLFLDWSGYVRVLFPLALTALWLLLAWSLGRGWKDEWNQETAGRMGRIGGLAVLAPA